MHGEGFQSHPSRPHFPTSPLPFSSKQTLQVVAAFIFILITLLVKLCTCITCLCGLKQFSFLIDRGMAGHGWFLPATGVLATIIQLKPETLTPSIINDAIITMAVVAVLIHVVCSAFEDILEAGHFRLIAAGTGHLARALAITLLLIICVPKIWWFLLSAWVLFFIWVTYTLLYNAVHLRQRHGQAQEPNELPNELP